MGKMYVGVDSGSGGIARNVKTIYVGVNGVARKVIRGYVGVNGVARQFWGDGGGGTIVFEYDYGINQTYQIHNYLTLEDTLDACYNKFMENVGTYSSTYANIQYFISQWQSIRAYVISTLGSSSLNITNIICTIRSTKSNGQSNSYTLLTVRFGDDVFPLSVRVSGSTTDSFGNTSYTLATSPTPPQSDQQVRVLAYADHYDVNPIETSTGSMNRIGFLNNNSSTYYSNAFASFGMKKV